MESDLSSIQCKAEFFYKVKATLGSPTASQDYGEGTLLVGSESLSFNPYKELKIKGGMKGGMLKSLASTNIKLFPYPIMQYRDIMEFKVDKKKLLGVVLHQPYSVNPLTGEEILAIPRFETDMILLLKFSDDETRDYTHRQIVSRWESLRRSAAEVGYGSKSPSMQPATAKPISADGVAGYCKNCGQPFATGQKFCGKCGNGLT